MVQKSDAIVHGLLLFVVRGPSIYPCARAHYDAIGKATSVLALLVLLLLLVLLRFR